MSRPHVIFGCALIGLQSFNDAKSLEEVITTLEAGGICQLDTAARYPPPKQGESERLIGQTNAGAKGFLIDTKVLMGFGDGDGELESQAIGDSIQGSLERLKIKQVNTLYCHRFDPRTPLAETAAAMDKHYREGKFKQAKWGVCRFPPEKLKELLEICDMEGYIKPSKYQGEYNVLTRGMEENLLPILRAHKLQYNAHRPFATGFLTGRFTSGDYEGTRFASDFPLHFVFRKEYDDQALHRAVQGIAEVLKPHAISTHEASLRWILFHSSLGPDDGVIFGCSKISQIKDNIASINAGPLPPDVVSKMNKLWLTLGSTRDQIL